MDRACSVDECERRAIARGWCGTHWARWRKHGTTDLQPQPHRGICSIVDCDNAHWSRGWCIKHYMRWYTTGTTALRQLPTNEERFWAKVDKTGTCWLWTGNTEPGGHGVFWMEGGNRPAHRVSYEWLVGPTLPWPAHHIDHLCRVPSCVNPAHLELVTAGENTRRQPRHVNRTHCLNGHPYEGNRGASRRCKVCHRERAARDRARRA